MNENEIPEHAVIAALNERAKELTCLYRTEECLNDIGADTTETIHKLVEIIPTGWQYEDCCKVCFEFQDQTVSTEGFSNSRWTQQADIFISDIRVGAITVSYDQSDRIKDYNPFLPEERKLLNSIADRFARFIEQKRLKKTVKTWEEARNVLATQQKDTWQVILRLLEKMDIALFLSVSKKMLNHLCGLGINEARDILQNVGMKKDFHRPNNFFMNNAPAVKKSFKSISALSEEVFAVATRFLDDEHILRLIQRWIKEDRISFLMKALEIQDTSLSNISDAISRYHNMKGVIQDVPKYTKENINALLIQRIFTEQLDFISMAKNHINIDDFYQILQHTIYPDNSHGKLGGKSAGLFFSSRITRTCAENNDLLKEIKIPKTWYISSDVLTHFLYHNHLEDIVAEKYKQIELIHEEYPNIIQIFKNSSFPPLIEKKLSEALKDFNHTPIIVRSSSLLEDRLGTSFCGKYKSLFLANQGSHEECLAALLDAIAEVYASTYGPDPIEYRSERGLLDFHEEMAIMIQQVIGSKVGHYFFPSFSGVAFSHNEFRWSPRIDREDGLLRIVPGLGTRAVDRLGNDYPKLVAPGKPTLNVNASADEIVRYSPHEMDVINLETNQFETVNVLEMLRKHGNEIPKITNMVSAFNEDHFVSKSLFNIDFEKDDLVVTFDGLINKTPFVEQMKMILDECSSRMQSPVDIEFAVSADGIHLLQCRPQAFSAENSAAILPTDLPDERILFTADRYVTNGDVPNITHVVYVDPGKYNELESLELLQACGRAVARLNSMLPKRQFILMGPGRWGSRGDIKLGVSVTYSDINNTAMLIEIAVRKGNYMPDLSFGTHFFQDLVEAQIRYLPLYPDEDNIIFNHDYLTQSDNLLEELIPDFSALTDVIHVIDVQAQSNGNILRIGMNADDNRAMAYFAQPEERPTECTALHVKPKTGSNAWLWRIQMTERMAANLNAERFGIKALYIVGSTKNATADNDSDIDLLVHFNGTEEQKTKLLHWFEGWSYCMGELNNMYTGAKRTQLLDVHLLTDEDIAAGAPYAQKINASTDAARPLLIGGEHVGFTHPKPKRKKV